eukprot:1525637-Pyramimonas_sp.AAC.1
MPQRATRMPSGFIKSPTIANDTVGLDCFSRVFSMSSASLACLPALVSFDFGRAFPSLGNEWPRLVL